MPSASPFARPPRTVAALLLGMSCLSACTVGPDYRGTPQVASTALRRGDFVRAPQQGLDRGAAPAAWWRSLGDAQLNALIEDALRNSPDLQAARARLRQARAGLRESHANAMPKLSASFAGVRMRSPDTAAVLSGEDGSAESTGRAPLQWYSSGFDASWEIDLFGGTRRAVEAASAQAEAVAADLADLHVSLAAEVAQRYIDLRDAQLRLALAQESVALQQRSLALTQQRRSRGVTPEADVERLRGNVESTRAAQVPLDAELSEALDRLAVLCGREPGALDAQLAARAPLPSLPAEVAVGEPAALLRQRPDIRAAERRLASSQAEIGERTADLFPKLSLFGSLGFSASDPGHLYRKDNATWLGVPYLSWNFLDFGRSRARIDQAEARRDEMAATYRGTVLAALRDANQALSRFGHQRVDLASQTEIEASAARSAALVSQRYRAGVASLIDLLDVQRADFSARQNRIAAQASLLKDFVSLQKSLGLGWQAQASVGG